MNINATFNKAKDIIKKKYKEITTSKKVRKVAYGMLPGILILIMLSSYTLTVRSSAEEYGSNDYVYGSAFLDNIFGANDENSNVNKVMEDISKQETKASIIAPVFEGLVEPLINGISIVDVVLQNLVENTFRPGVSQIVKIENYKNDAVIEDNERNYNITDSKILTGVWKVGSYIGAAIAMFTFLISLLIMIGGGSKQIKDNPLMLLLRFIIAMFAVLNSATIISFALSVFGNLWEGMNDLILTKAISMTNKDLAVGLFGVVKSGVLLPLKDMQSFGAFSLVILPLLILVYLVVFIKMVVTFFKVFKACVERYLTFMFTLCLAPLGIACFTSKMTQRVSATYLMFVFSEFVALMFDSLTIHIITFLTETGVIWKGIVEIIFYFAMAKVAIQMDSFLSKMGFNVIATGSQLAKSVGGTAQTMMAMARTTMKGRERAGNIGAAMFKDGVAEGNLAKQQAGARLATMFGGRSKADFTRDAAINTMENHVTATQVAGEFAIASVDGNRSMNTNEAARWMTQAVGANGTTYAPEMAQKGITITDGDKMINMGSGNFQHLDKDGNIKSAIVGGDVYSRAELDKSPQAMAKVNDFNSRNDKAMPFTQDGMVCRNDPNGNVSSYDMLVNNGCSEARAREFENYLNSQSSTAQNNYGQSTINNSMEGAKNMPNGTNKVMPEGSDGARLSMPESTDGARFNMPEGSDGIRPVMFEDGNRASMPDNGTAKEIYGEGPGKGNSKFENYNNLNNENKGKTSLVRNNGVNNTVMQNSKNNGTVNNRIAYTKGDGRGGFIARNSEGYVIGGMNQHGVRNMQSINEEIYASNAKKYKSQDVIQPNSYDFEGNEIDLNTSAGNRAMAENCGMNPDAQRQIVDNYNTNLEMDPSNKSLFATSTPVYLGNSGETMALIDNHTGNANCYVSGSRVWFDHQADLHYNADLARNGIAGGNVSTARKDILQRVRDFREAKKEKAKVPQAKKKSS